MQSDKHIFRGKAASPITYEVHDDYMNYGPFAPDLGTIPPFGPDFSRPFQGFELQPSEVCPKNFIIFDQADNKSRIMYHPALKQKFAYPSPDCVDIHAAFLQGYGTREDVCDRSNESSSSMKEDTKDIDALMSLEAEDLEEDDEVISTARTYGNYDCSSPESCSNYCPKSSKRRVSSMENSSGYCSSNEDDDKQRQRMKKMLKALRRIVPGADNMSTATLVDEAVTYLKSLKVEVKKLGLGNFEN